MEALARFGKIALASGSVALAAMEVAHLEPSKVHPAEEVKRVAEKSTVEEKKQQEEAKTAARRSRAPKMAPQFDGLNFYETFIGASQR